MDKLKLETMKALMEALPSLARSGAKRIKYGEFEVEFHEPTARRGAETMQQQPSEQEPQVAGWTRPKPDNDGEPFSEDQLRAAGWTRLEMGQTVTAPSTPVQVKHPAEPEEDEEPGDPLFHHLPPSQRPSIS